MQNNNALGATQPPQTQQLGLGTPPMPSPVPPQDSPQISQQMITPKKVTFEIKNLADGMDEEKLQKIGSDCKRGYDIDVESLSILNQKRASWMKLYSLSPDKKTFPWPDASNVMIPMITTACLNFYSRAFTNIMGRFPYLNVYPFKSQAEDIVRADKVKKHMNFQIAFEMKEILNNYRKLYIATPRDGCGFTKVYHDPYLKRNVLEHILLEDLVVNYNCRDFYKAPRITHVLYMNLNEIKKRGKSYDGVKKFFINTEGLEVPSTPNLPHIKTERDKDSSQQQPQADYTTPRVVCEQHTDLDLNDSGIREPYIIWFDYESGKVLRIVSRKNPKNKEKLLEYFTLYTFFPNDGSIYGDGFGNLLLAINHAANTNINQMTDAATLSNMKTGVFSSKSGIKRGTFRLQMGEFTEIDSRVEDISKVILPIKFDPPSSVLLTLVNFLQGYVDRITTVTELFTGGTPRSDTSATATQSAVQLGMVTFTNIQSGFVESHNKDYEKMYVLNSLYLDNEKSQFYIPGQSEGDDTLNFISVQDYAEDMKIIPTADPKIISSQQLIQKAEYLNQAIMQNPILAQNPEAIAFVLKKRLEAMEFTDADIEAMIGLMDRAVGEANAAQQQQAQTLQQQSGQMQQAHDQGYAKGATHATMGHEVMQKAEEAKKAIKAAPTQGVPAQ